MTDSIWDAVVPAGVADGNGHWVNPFATYGPAYRPGESWHDYFHAYRLALHPPQEDGDEADEATDGEIVVIQEAEEFDDPISALASVVSAAHKSGWILHTMAHALSTAMGKVTKTGPNKGRKAPDKEQELQWAFFEKEGVGRAVISYLISNGVVVGSMTRRSFNGERVSAADFKRLLKG